jgi:hypothetical protein
MALRQKPDRLVVPRRARVLTGSITSRQIFDAQVVFDMGHSSPPRFMAAHANRFDPKTESAMPESFARKPYQIYGFDLESLHEALGLGVVIWIAAPAHGAYEAVLS